MEEADRILNLVEAGRTLMTDEKEEDLGQIYWRDPDPSCSDYWVQDQTYCQEEDPDRTYWNWEGGPGRTCSWPGVGVADSSAEEEGRTDHCRVYLAAAAVAAVVVAGG